jgi:hypothetical protein
MKDRKIKQVLSGDWSQVGRGWWRFKEGKYSGDIIYSYMKMEK